MTKAKEIGVILFQEAMDNLAAIVGLDLDHPPRLGIVGRHRFVTDADAVGPYEIVWLSGEGIEPILEILDATFHSLYRHLTALLENSEINWDDPKVRRGVQSMIALSAEAADKMNRYLELRLGKKLTQRIEERPAFQELHYFYEHRFSKTLKGGDENWSKEWNENREAALLDASKTGLKDFETVRRDLEYELFSIGNPEGQPYFNDDLLRNIKLVCFEMNKEISFEEDPLLRIRAIEDRDMQASARQILSECQPLIEDFYKYSKKTADLAIAQYVNIALVALFLASNPRNLIQNTNGKSSLLYFHDFQASLRKAINSNEYQKLTAYPPEKEEKFERLQLQLIHALCHALFYRGGGVKQEVIGLLHRCMRKGEEQNVHTAVKGETIWNQLLIEDERLRSYLTLFPNGPLFKIIDLVREQTPEERIFDPFLQGNLPQKLCAISLHNSPVQVLRIPCPTRQALINKVTIVEEFRGFLRSYRDYTSGPKIHCLINFQDRTSWLEYARARSLETLQKNAEFSGELLVITLPKRSDFYHQNNEYLNVNHAEDFLAQFQLQLASSDDCGFFFPPQLAKPLHDFFPRVLTLIYTHFFQGKSTLSRRNREDFIEIFYQLLILKCIDLLKPRSLSFTCKDAIDVGATALSTFVGFLSLLTGDFSHHLDFLRYLLYAPALFIRERAVDAECFHRAIAALEQCSLALPAEIQAIGELYSPQLLKSLKIE